MGFREKKYQKIRSKYTEDWVPIKTINNGMIVLPNNENVTGVKIIPRNIFILEYDQQQEVLTALKNVYNMIDYEFWLVFVDS